MTVSVQARAAGDVDSDRPVRVETRTEAPNALPQAICRPVLLAGERIVDDHGTPLIQCIVVDEDRNDNAVRARRNGAVATSILALAPHGEPTDAEVLVPSADADWLSRENLALPFDLRSLDGMSGVAGWVRYYTTDGRRRIQSYFARAGRYQAMIEDELRNQDAPLDLLWVVAIESNFEPEAGSSAGARGLWQFMERTAISRGLRVDREVDERLDVERSTREAITYLKLQQTRFGSWPLALAAYNAGSGHVRSSIREHGVTELDAMERYGAVYQDARAYAAKIIAIALIARNRAYFGFDAVVPDAPVEWDTVTVEEDVRLSLIADAAGVPASQVIALNPALRARAVPRGGYDVRIPKGTFGTFVQSYDRVASRYGKAHSSVVLRFGETLATVARREGIPERVLRAVNGFSSSERVPYGTVLVVPESSRRPTTTSATATEKPTIVVAETEFSYPDRARVFYQANPLDRLTEIAEYFGVSPYQLAAWNELDPNATIWGGMVFQLWIDPNFNLDEAIVLREEDVDIVRMGTPEWVAWRQQDESTSERTPAPARRSHRVRAGDTVLRIAGRYGVDASDIVRWNRLRDSQHIVIGQDLWVSPPR